MFLIKKGHRGEEASDIQRRLVRLGYSLGLQRVDGIFGEETEAAVKKFQQERGLVVDGVVGEETWQELVGATYFFGDRTLYLKSPPFRGDDVKELQTYLRTLGFNPGSLDGIFGPATQKAVRDFQRNTGLPNDGMVGFSTIESLRSLRAILDPNTKVDFPRNVQEPLSSISTIKGRKIVVDPGHGGFDTGALGSTGLKESDIAYDIGIRFGDLLKLLGAQVIYTRGRKEYKKPTERGDLANRRNASLFISIHLNSSANLKAEGITTYFFSSGNYFSQKGKRLADLIQQALVSSLKRRDDRVHGKNFVVLRLTKMTAVVVEPLFITNEEDERLLQQEDFRQKIAVAIFDGLKNYLNLGLKVSSSI